MKALPKRKGNPNLRGDGLCFNRGLNESPSEKEGKYWYLSAEVVSHMSLNESPSEKEGKLVRVSTERLIVERLNESPSEKEGKW